MSAPKKKRRIESSKDPDVWMTWLEKLSSGEGSPLDKDDENYNY